jgi:hypothetical protein
MKKLKHQTYQSSQDLSDQNINSSDLATPLSQTSKHTPTETPNGERLSFQTPEQNSGIYATPQSNRVNDPRKTAEFGQFFMI